MHIEALAKTLQIRYYRYMETIYLDNCSYNRPFDDQSQLRISLEAQAKLYIQSLIKTGRLDLVWSYVLDYENYNNPFENKQISITEFSKYAKYSVIETPEILATADRIIKLKIKPVDALHLSCAINAKVDYFITVDDGILKHYTETEIKVMEPVTFVKYWQIREVKND
jgi:predicted nucleic acid-binding protein